MADEIQPVIATTENSSETISSPPVESAGDLAARHDAAGKFLAALHSGESPAAETRTRDAHGRFITKATPAISTESTTDVAAEPASVTTPTETSPSPPTLDPIWAEAAKEEGLPDSVIASFKTPDDVQSGIALHRMKQLQRLGIDPAEYVQYIQSKQNRQTSPAPDAAAAPAAAKPDAAAAMVAAIEDLKVTIDENELAPEVVGPLKAIVDYANKLKAGMADTRKLQQKVDALEGYIRQSVESYQQAQQSQRDTQWAEEQWDKAAEETPGFTEYFGKPSELKHIAQANPSDKKVMDAAAFDGYFQGFWRKYSEILGEGPKALSLALRDAWKASPFSRIGAIGGNGNKGNGAPAIGSVIRTGNGRASTTTQPATNDLNAELERIASTLGDAWNTNGGNPWSS